MVLVKPDNKDSFRPSDAYLQGSELEEFMDLETIFYEKKPIDGTTALFMYDPSNSSESNKLFKEKFPNYKAIFSDRTVIEESDDNSLSDI